jgi:hypothetical protein
LKYVGALERGLAHLSWCNSGWFYHTRPHRKEWQPKSTRADVKTSADAYMVFVLPAEFHARGREELSVAHLDLEPRPVIFEKPRAKNYKYLKALYLKGYINGQPVNKMLVDT